MLTVCYVYFTFKEGAHTALVLVFFSGFFYAFLHKKRATDESRTRDLFLTKEALYH